MSTNPNQAPYPHLADYRRIIKPRQQISIPKNPTTRYRPKTWKIPTPTGYTKSIRVQDLEDTQHDLTAHYAFVAQELLTGLLHP